MQRFARILAAPGIAAALSMATATAAVAQPGAEPASEPGAAPGPLALIAELGFYSGTGVGAMLDLDTINVRASAGFMPVVVSSGETPDDTELGLFATGQLSVDVGLLPIVTSSGARLGITGGYRYNTLLGSGGAGGVAARLALSDRLGLHFAFGLMWYPDGEDRVVEESEFGPDDEFSFPGPRLQSGATVGLTFYP